MKNSNQSFKFNILNSKSRSNKKNNGMLETLDADDLKDLADKEEHTMLSEQSSVRNPNYPSISKNPPSKQTILF